MNKQYITQNNTKKFRRVNEKTPNAGFTLVETMIAVLVLTISVSAMMNLAAASFFSVRYSRNDIVGNNLMQEAVEYMRNSRDTAYLGGTTTINSWVTNVFDVCSNPNGCIVDPYRDSVSACPTSPSECPKLVFYDGGGNSTSFYGYSGGSGYPIASSSTPIQTTYLRTVKMRNVGGQYITDITLKWKNGLNDKTITQSFILTDWNN